LTSGLFREKFFNTFRCGRQQGRVGILTQTRKTIQPDYTMESIF